MTVIIRKCCYCNEPLVIVLDKWGNLPEGIEKSSGNNYFDEKGDYYNSECKSKILAASWQIAMNHLTAEIEGDQH